jgi:hypothetical protein
VFFAIFLSFYVTFFLQPESKRTCFLGKNPFFFQIEVVVHPKISPRTSTSNLTLPEGIYASKD